MLRYTDFRLRSLSPIDKEMVLAWRNLDRVRVNMYSDHLISPEEHDWWFQKALLDETARYLVFEYQERPVGFVSFTDISTVHGRSRWAFYLGETDIPKGTGYAMEFFALSYAFEQLGIRKLCCEVFVFNASVIKLHEKFGFVHEGRFARHFVKNGNVEDIVCLAKFRESWADSKVRLKARCFGEEGK